MSTEENFKNNKFAWNQFYYGEYVSPVEKEINIYRLDFADKELYSIHFNATDTENLYNYNYEVSALKRLISDTLLYGILFIEKEKYRYFEGSVINFNLDINKKSKFSEIENHFEYSEFIDYLSKKLNYDFTFLK